MTLRLRPLLCAIALCATAFAHGQARQPADQLDVRFANGIIAIVEDRAITVEDVRREIAPLLPEIEREARNEREYYERLEILQNDIIQNLVDRVLIVKEFYKDEKRRIPAAFIDNAVNDAIMEQFEGDRSKFLAYLRSRGKSQRDFRREIEEDIIYSYMRGQMRKSQSVVSPVRVETFYNENRDRFFQDDAVHLRLIQLNRGDLSDVELRARADAAIRRIQAGESFAEVARDVSQDARRNRGGDWGWQKRADLKSEFADVLFSLEKGQHTQPLILPEGAFILFVEDRRYAGIQPIDEVRDQIERILVTQMAREAQERWLERLRRNGYVRYF